MITENRGQTKMSNMRFCAISFIEGNAPIEFAMVTRPKDFGQWRKYMKNE